MSTNINDIANAIANELRNYTSEIIEEVETAKKEVAKKTVKELKKAGNFKNVSGRYRKGWRTKKVGDTIVIHNKTDYQLTHLLEKGHVIANGEARYPGRVPAYPHIAPAEEKAVREFTERVERAIRS